MLFVVCVCFVFFVIWLIVVWFCSMCRVTCIVVTCCFVAVRCLSVCCCSFVFALLFFVICVLLSGLFYVSCYMTVDTCVVLPLCFV